MYFLHILQFLFCIHISLTYTFETLSKMLTQKDLRSWFTNETKITDNKNPYCRLCCIKLSATTIGKKCGQHTMCKYKVNVVGEYAKYVNVICSLTK